VSAPIDDSVSIWANAAHAAALFAVDIIGTGGVSLRGRPGPVRDSWLALLRELLPDSSPLRRCPHNVSDDRLLGGLDLSATLQAGRPIMERGLLAQADQGVIVLTMAERASSFLAGRLGAVLDSYKVAVARDAGLKQRSARVGLVLLDEGIDDERPQPALLDRLAFHIHIDGIRWSDTREDGLTREHIAAARLRLPEVKASDDILLAMCETAAAFGIPSIRASLFALRAASAAAALAGRCDVSRDDAALAAALVLAPRATTIPIADDPPPADEDGSETDAADDRPERETEENQGTPSSDRQLNDVIIQAAQTAIPPGLLAQLQLSSGKTARTLIAGPVGATQTSLRHGRPAGVRRGEPRAGVRLNVIETLRAAAPWQMLRRREAQRLSTPRSPGTRVEVRRDDFRVTRREQRTETTSIFAVDGSGSSALHRLAEAKGAIEQLLADCYVRRDRVALLAFRGTDVELILPPTRSLARAKRCLAGLPGGGGTPLAAAIDAAAALAEATRRKGQTPVVVLLTDGRANIARNRQPGRAQAELDALTSARSMREAKIAALVVDISPQPHASANRLAAEMGAHYLPLPYADAKTLSRAVQATSAQIRAPLDRRPLCPISKR
jgi:magnesium chelatase subunit D